MKWIWSAISWLLSWDTTKSKDLRSRSTDYIEKLLPNSQSCKYLTRTSCLDSTSTFGILALSPPNSSSIKLFRDIDCNNLLIILTTISELKYNRRSKLILKVCKMLCLMNESELSSQHPCSKVICSWSNPITCVYLQSPSITYNWSNCGFMREITHIVCKILWGDVFQYNALNYQKSNSFQGNNKVNFSESATYQKQVPNSVFCLSWVPSSAGTYSSYFYKCFCFLAL